MSGRKSSERPGDWFDRQRTERLADSFVCGEYGSYAPSVTVSDERYDAVCWEAQNNPYIRGRVKK